jgi:hypothetical protein
LDVQNQTLTLTEPAVLWYILEIILYY